MLPELCVQNVWDSPGGHKNDISIHQGNGSLVIDENTGVTFHYVINFYKLM